VYKLIPILLLVFLFGNTSLFSQEKIGDVLIIKDTLKKQEINPLAPAKAAFYSAILPGLGQAYNKKYWKIPLVYGAIGSGVYFYSKNNTKYRQFRDEYKKRLDGTSNSQDPYFGNLDNSRLIAGQRFYQRNRDISVLVTAAFYVLNIVDANIDAHLLQFNVNDNLSVHPDISTDEINYKQNVGLTLNYHF
jgi:hypothetical protein